MTKLTTAHRAAIADKALAAGRLAHEAALTRRDLNTRLAAFREAV